MVAKYEVPTACFRACARDADERNAVPGDAADGPGRCASARANKATRPQRQRRTRPFLQELEWLSGRAEAHCSDGVKIARGPAHSDAPKISLEPRAPLGTNPELTLTTPNPDDPGL